MEQKNKDKVEASCQRDSDVPSTMTGADIPTKSASYCGECLDAHITKSDGYMTEVQKFLARTGGKIDDNIREHAYFAKQHIMQAEGYT